MIPSDSDTKGFLSMGDACGLGVGGSGHTVYGDGVGQPGHPGQGDGVGKPGHEGHGVQVGYTGQLEHGEQVGHSGQTWVGEGVGIGQLTGLGVGHLEQSWNVVRWGVRLVLGWIVVAFESEYPVPFRVVINFWSGNCCVVAVFLPPVM